MDAPDARDDGARATSAPSSNDPCRRAATIEGAPCIL